MINKNDLSDLKKKIDKTDIQLDKWRGIRRVLNSEATIINLENLKISEANESKAKKILIAIMMEQPHFFIDENLDINKDSIEGLLYYPYKRMLIMAEKFVSDYITNLSIEKLRLENLKHSIVPHHRKQYQIACEMYEQRLEDGDLCLDETDKSIFEEIANVLETSYDVIRQQVDKNFVKYPQLNKLINQRRRAKKRRPKKSK